MTIHCDEQLAREIDSRAKLQGISRNQVMIELIRRGLELDEPSRESGVIGDSLDWFIGSWTPDEAREFDEAVSGYGRVDQDLWT
jgi:hypothetical protein